LTVVGHVDIAELLLGAGADLSRTMNGRTARQVAVDFDNVDIVHLIERHGSTSHWSMCLIWFVFVFSCWLCFFVERYFLYCMPPCMQNIAMSAFMKTYCHYSESLNVFLIAFPSIFRQL